VLVEVDVQEKLDFRLGEMAFYLEKTAIKGLRASASHGRGESRPIVGSQRADFDAPSIAQRARNSGLPLT
jgi:hypothetical protein